MLEIKKAEQLPPVRRGGGRTSKDREQIIEALQSGEVRRIDAVEQGKPFNALQQRIRQAAAKIGVKVTIRTEPSKTDEGKLDLFFQRYDVEKPKLAKKSAEKAVANS